MNRFLASLSLLALLAPNAHATTALYGTNALDASFQTYQPNNALGAPDKTYTAFFARDAGVTLDFIDLAKGDLVMNYQLLNFGAKYLATFYDANKAYIGISGATLNIAETITIPGPNSGIPYRYVRISNDSSQTWNLDALTAQGSDTAQTPTPEPTPAPTPSPAPESPLTAGTLIKLADDGNATTSVDSAVYTLGSDGKRHAFPAESVFYSWYTDFSGVRVVSGATMASYPLGKNVTIRPGTKLVKIQTDPKTYAVAAGNTLRWIPTETLAISLFGTDWAKEVVDVADTFFGNYVMGPDLSPLDAAPSIDPNIIHPY